MRKVQSRWAFWLVIGILVMVALFPTVQTTSDASWLGTVRRRVRAWVIRHENWLLPLLYISGIASMIVGAVFDAWWAAIILALSTVTLGLPFSIWCRSPNWINMSGLGSLVLLLMVIGPAGMICTNTALFAGWFCNELAKFGGLDQWSPVYMAIGFALLGVVVSASWPWRRRSP